MALGSIITGTMANRRAKDAAKESRNASRDLTRRMEGARDDIGAYRPEAAEARMRALRARLGIMEPLSNMTGAITGMPQADLAPLGQSPLAMKPLPSQLEVPKPSAGVDPRLTGSFGVGAALDDPRNPNGPNSPDAKRLLEEKLRGYGYNVPPRQGK